MSRDQKALALVRACPRHRSLSSDNDDHIMSRHAASGRPTILGIVRDPKPRHVVVRRRAAALTPGPPSVQDGQGQGERPPAVRPRDRRAEPVPDRAPRRPRAGGAAAPRRARRSARLDLGPAVAPRPAGRPGPRGRRSPRRCRSAARRPGTCGPSPRRPGWPSGWRSGPTRSGAARWRCPPRGVRTGTPTASTWTASEPSRHSTMSRSWIIRSRTTSMSRLRGENEPSRWTSMKRGRGDVRAQDVHRRVEALDVADLQHDARARRRAR